MDYARAKKLHPKLKVRNVKRLIREIRRSAPVEMARARAVREPLKVGRREAVCRDAYIGAADDIGKSRVPLVFNMTNWMVPEPVERGLMGISLSRVTPTCGTAACIAGFAAALTPKSGRFLVDKALRHCSHRTWERVLADFIGVDEETADKMTGTDLAHMQVFNSHVLPRHAVKLLEIFLETGKVDWARAMGRKKDGEVTKAEAAALRREEMEMEAMAA